MSEFMCSCSTQSEAECQRAYYAVRKEVLGTNGNDREFMTGLVQALNFIGENHYAYISEIVCDQWCGVNVTLRKHGEDLDKEKNFFVMCDVVEHGLARAYQLAKEAVAND